MLKNAGRMLRHVGRRLCKRLRGGYLSYVFVLTLHAQQYDSERENIVSRVWISDPGDDSDTEFSGWHSLHLRPLSRVDKCTLSEGLTFPHPPSGANKHRILRIVRGIEGEQVHGRFSD